MWQRKFNAISSLNPSKNRENYFFFCRTKPSAAETNQVYDMKFAIDVYHIGTNLQKKNSLIFDIPVQFNLSIGLTF